MERNSMITKDDIKGLLKENIGEIKEFGVKRIGIFGSSVRNEIKNNSDIDIIVEFKKGRGGFKDFGGLIEFLEDKFGREIDLLTIDGLENIRIDSVKKRILKEIEYV